MIEHILNALNDERNQEGYVTALAMFQSGTPLKKAKVEKLAALYEKHGTDLIHPELIRFYMALDLMPGHSREDAAVFAPLGLPLEGLDGLFLAKEAIALLMNEETPDAEAVNAAVEAAVGGSVPRPVDIFLARSLLNGLAWRWDFGGFRDQAARLASFLIDAGADVLNEYSIFFEEANKKCRN